LKFSRKRFILCLKEHKAANSYSTNIERILRNVSAILSTKRKGGFPGGILVYKASVSVVDTSPTNLMFLMSYLGNGLSYNSIQFLPWVSVLVSCTDGDDKSES
jgi:hypothetical protein